MALVLANLKSSLENDWLVPEGGDYPASSSESGDRFAGAVASWFGQGMAMGSSCSTADSRKGQLAALAAQAFEVGDPSASGGLLAAALLAYMAGQSFGSGVASAPTATSAAAATFSAVFADLEMSNSERAQQIGSGCQTMAQSTIVIFSGSPPPTATIV